MKRRNTEQTGHDLDNVLGAELDRHEAAVDEIRFKADERRGVVQARLAELEAEAKVLQDLSRI